MNEQSDMQKLYAKLLDKALEDGIITEEEQAILDDVKMNIGDYEKLLSEALEDEIITEKEAKDLRNSRAKMLDMAWLTADKDAEIDPDEAGLLNLMLNLLKKIEMDK
ncbi:MAG: hypothetical protein HeimC2_17710 [Candidatus Heimdallarchaeota archaeon LC_2]|nr:MAG: hypothetical protein HeimC2_17710 [Candidatus Heimdallarchaeota archaeon LC_2]